jgi:predicted protein tyrosine phosphatase
MKYKFICNWEKNRSPVGARIAREMGLERGVDIESSSMALFPEESYEYEKKTKKKLEEMDIIFVMTSKMVEIVRERYGIFGEKVVNLEIDDDYCAERMFEKIFRRKLDKYISLKQ